MARISDAPVRRGRTATTWAVCLAVGLSLAGCAAPDTPTSTGTATSTPTAAAGTETPTTAPVPELDPTGSATENQAFFDSVIAAALAADASAAGRSYIDALVAGGFDKTTMEVTADTTTMGKPADSVQFSVIVNGECLVGQNGPSSGGYHSVVAPLLATGTCLVGATRQIDW